MGKVTKFVVCGPSGVGKTSFIEHCIYGNYTARKPEDFISTYEDTYNAVVETDRGLKEKVRIYDLGGTAKIEKHFVNCADAFILIYDLNDSKTFQSVQMLKKEIDRFREKRDILVVLCGHKSDKPKDTTLDTKELIRWMQHEKIANIFETSVYDRQSLIHVFTWIISRLNQLQTHTGLPLFEPQHILIPTTKSKSDSIGPCTSLLSVPDKVINLNINFISGHLNGWIVLWCLDKRRNIHQWNAHASAQILCLHYWSKCSQSKGIIISHGRDGFIRFWDVDSFILKQFNSNQPLLQALNEIQTCEVTFCNSTFWSKEIQLPSSSLLSNSEIYFLAHLCNDDENSTKGSMIEVMQFPNKTITCQIFLNSIETLSLNHLGMCMALEGIERFSYEINQMNTHILFLAGFESGHLILFGNNHILTILTNSLGLSIPIITMKVKLPSIDKNNNNNNQSLTDSNHYYKLKQMKRLILLGGPSRDEDTATIDEKNTIINNDLIFIKLIISLDQLSKQYNLIQLNKSLLPNQSIGISCFTWCTDNNLLAIGYWNGQICLIHINEKIDCGKQKFQFQCLGWLNSLGMLSESQLLGEWCSISNSKPYGPNIDQKSKLIRSCIFTNKSNFLISTVSANASPIGSVLVWDLYRK